MNQEVLIFPVPVPVPGSPPLAQRIVPKDSPPRLERRRGVCAVINNGEDSGDESESEDSGDESEDSLDDEFDENANGPDAFFDAGPHAQHVSFMARLAEAENEEALAAGDDAMDMSD